MKKTSKWISIAVSALLGTLAIVPASSCTDTALDADFFPSVTIAQADGNVVYQPTIDGNPNKVEIPLLSGDIYTVCANYTKCITEGYNLEYKDCFAPTPLTLSWECAEEALYYTLDISTKSDMSDAESYVTFDNEVTLQYLFMGYDYYYQISAKYEDKIVKSRIFEFSTAYLPRTVYVDDNVSNTRDWGGYLTVDGKRVRQGIVYRGGTIDNITQAGKDVMLKELGIKTDLDVRGSAEVSVPVSPLGDDVNYILAKGPYYVGSYGSGIDLEGEFREGFVTEIKAFANPDNFPIYVHCSLGRDRTGTLCFLINALLGVSETDLYRDYEVSMMARTGKTPTQGSTHMVKYPFTALYAYIKNFERGKTLQENAEAYLLSIGITEDEIRAIKDNMLEEVQ